MKALLGYIFALGILLGGSFLAIQTVIDQAVTAVAAGAKPVASEPAVVARTDSPLEPVVDMNDPDLFDARGKFPPALREAMAKAKLESTKAFTRPEKPKKVAQRKKPRAKPAIAPGVDSESGPFWTQSQRAVAQAPNPPWNGFGFPF